MWENVLRQGMKTCKVYENAGAIKGRRRGVIRGGLIVPPCEINSQEGSEREYNLRFILTRLTI